MEGIEGIEMITSRHAWTVNTTTMNSIRQSVWAGVISIPGNPLVSSDISYVDPGTEKLYEADRSNFGVDVIDVETNTWLGRVDGFVGPTVPPPHTPALTPPPNGQGPNGVVVTPGRLLFAGDGNSNLQVADVDPSHLSTYLKIIQTISTADPECDSGSVHQCNRADEVGWDPVDRIIMVANDAPTPAGISPAYPYASLYHEVNPTTYTPVGRVFFPGAGGLEQPVWDPELRRFFITVPGSATQGPGVAVIDPLHPVTPLTPQYLFNCTALGSTGTAANGAVLGSFQHLLVSICGVPVILNALNGHVINVITQVGGGDEVAFNHGDGRFYVASTDKTTAPTAAPPS